jgi:uracil-DNA glycosylase
MPVVTGDRRIMDSETRARAAVWLRYAQDLRLGPYYRDRATSPSAAAESPPVLEQLQTPQNAGGVEDPTLSSDTKRSQPSGDSMPEASRHSRLSIAIPLANSSSLFEETIENDSLDRIRDDIGLNCTRCKLHKARKNIVFGVGNPKAQLVFVGEGPGRDEDEQGEPFVGRAGKLLTQMIEAMGLKRSDVYICNVVKCRPPENRLPEKDEITTCSPYLFRQLGVIAPKVICALGSCSAQTMLQTTQGISRFRGEWFDYHGSKLIATYHPAYLLRNPPAKSEVWKDLQKIMAYLGLELPRKK